MAAASSPMHRCVRTGDSATPPKGGLPGHAAPGGYGLPNTKRSRGGVLVSLEWNATPSKAPAGAPSTKV